VTVAQPAKGSNAGPARMLGGMAGRVSSPVFVGRQAELDAAVDALDRAAAGQPVHLLVAGEAGVGKTRFTSEVAREATERGFRVLRGECVNLGGSSLPYWPLVEVLRGLTTGSDEADVAELAGPSRADLARLVPSFGTDATESLAQSEWVQTRLFEGLLGLFSRLADRAPTLIVFEDLHWADQATREAIGFLIRSLHDVPIVLLGTYRADELHRRHPLLPWLAEIERDGRVERLTLTRFDRAQLGALIAAILGSAPQERLVGDVFDRSDGNPFFAEELLAASRPGSGSPRLPPTLKEILLAHLATVEDPAATVLGAAAVAGRRVTHELLSQVVDLPDERLHDGLRAAIGGNLLVVETDADTERYAFRHALVQEVVYEELLPGERRTLHRAIAEALAAGPAGPRETEAGRWAELAHHWAAAREDRRAFEASLRAGEAAIGSFAFDAALQDWERALDLWDGVDDPAGLAGTDRVELLRRAGLAAYLAADYRRAVAHRRAAVAAVDRASQPLRAGMLLEELGRALFVLGDSAASLDAYREAAAVIPADPPSAERARAVSGMGQITMLLARYDESRTLCEEAVALARSVGARQAEGHAMSTLGLDLAVLGDAGGVAMIESAIEIAREVRDADDIGRGYVNLAEACNLSGDTRRAAEVTLEGLRVADETGIASSYGHFIRAGGIAFDYLLGRWDEARRALDASVARTPAGPNPEAYRLANSLPFLVGSGAFDEADDALPRALDLIHDVLGAQFSGPIHGAAAERELWRHDPKTALEFIERGLAQLQVTHDWFETARLCRVGAWAVADLAESARPTRDAAALERTTAWLAVLRERLERAQTVGTTAGPGPGASTDWANFEAEAARATGAPDPKAWRTAADGWDRADRPYFAAIARWREAEAHLAAGDRITAARALRVATESADRLGARPLLETVRALARRARISLEPVAAGAPEPAPTTEIDRFGLTPRETEVLELLAEGRTNRQIAETLFISESTAGVHVSNILGKLGVANRVEAAAIAYRLGVTR
jgi:DNA-binding CsgD family transcriptional regulator/tetratricopeptide (TPR) repeat protein